MEDKEYSIKGKVEIGTDEYRDLIEARLILEKEASNERSRRWDTENKLKELSDKLEIVTSKMNKLITYINTKNLTENFKIWQLEQEESEDL